MLYTSKKKEVVVYVLFIYLHSVPHWWFTIYIICASQCRSDHGFSFWAQRLQPWFSAYPLASPDETVACTSLWWYPRKAFIFLHIWYSFIFSSGVQENFLCQSICVLPIGNLMTWPNCYHHLFTCAAPRTDGIPCAQNTTNKRIWTESLGNDSCVSLHALNQSEPYCKYASDQSWTRTTNCQTGVCFPSGDLSS